MMEWVPYQESVLQVGGEMLMFDENHIHPVYQLNLDINEITVLINYIVSKN